MLQQFHLPPRPPFQRKVTTGQLDEHNSKKPPPRGNNRCNGHKKSLSQGSVLDYDDEDESSPIDTSCGGAYESACVFGPNSPRGRASADFMGKSMLGASSHHGSRILLPFFEEGYRGHEHGSFDGSCSTNNLNGEQKQGKRHSRQRSRVRKLQYIAELDKSVNDLQALVSELQYQVSALRQQRFTLSVENTKLKQQALKLHQQKLILDSEYQLQRREAERLKSGLARVAYQNKVGALTHPRLGLNHVNISDDSWVILDWGKLNFN